MEKYQKLFFTRLSTTLQQWREKEHVSNDELYRFLHSLKGTAASIGLEKISELAEELHNRLDFSEDRLWTQSELRDYLSEIINEINNRPSNSPIKEKELTNESTNSYVVSNNKLILLIEDDIEMLKYLKENLESEGYTVLATTDSNKALSIFYNQRPDCVLIDIYLEIDNGLDLFKKIVESAHHHLIPVMFISADKQLETRLKAYELGATDFFCKPINLKEFKAILKNRLSYRDLLSSHILEDELTGAYNRRFLKNEATRFLALFEKMRTKFTVAMLDIDFFKRVNDQYGHDVGDIVLKELAKLIKENKRPSDYLIRLGGEEFLLLLPDTTEGEGEQVVNRLLTLFSEKVFHSGDESFACTFSAGVSEVKDSIKKIDALIKEADIALYEAKHSGRNQVVVFNETMTTTVELELQKLHIGIIDDDPVIHQLLLNHLKKITIKGYEIELKAFREGESFFESKWHLNSGKFVLLLDGILPRMDGLEVLSKVRKETDNKNVLVIMLTGRKNDKDIVKALELGADDYLTKPFSLNELEARIIRLTNRLIVS